MDKAPAKLRARSLALWLGVGLLSAVGCRQIIGIEDAELDPALSDQPAAGAPSSNGAPLTGGGAGSSAGQSGSDTAGGAPSDGGAAGGGAGARPIGDGGAPASSLCERYCSAVMSNCQGQFAVYTSAEICLAVCALLPPGKPGDREVNSVECRLHAATIAENEMLHYCPIAGPGGNGKCGSNCQGYCALMAGICSEWSAIEPGACLGDCEQLPDLSTFTTDPSAQNYRGNHVQCRMFHACAALVDDARQHCEHASGAAPCR